MLRPILAITGRPGLFKIVSSGARMLIVEDLISGKRMPAHQRDKIVSLGDIAMYTEGEDLALGEIMQRLYDAQKGEKIDLKELPTSSDLRDKFASVVPDFDRERVHDSDIKKLFQWYNILVEAGFDKFVADEEENEEEAPAAE